MTRNSGSSRRGALSPDSIMNNSMESVKSSELDLSKFLCQLIRELLSYIEFQLICNMSIDQLLEDYEFNRILKKVEEKRIRVKQFEVCLLKELENFSLFNERLQSEKILINRMESLNSIKRYDVNNIFPIKLDQQNYTGDFKPKLHSSNNIIFTSRKSLYYNYNINYDYNDLGITKNDKNMEINNHNAGEESALLRISQARVLIRELIEVTR